MASYFIAAFITSLIGAFAITVGILFQQYFATLARLRAV